MVSSTFDRVVSCAIALSALTVAGVYVRRELYVEARTREQLAMRSSAAAPPLAEPQTAFIDGWEVDAAQGTRIGITGARVVIVEFMDFQCPFCARLAGATDTILREFPGEVAVSVQHFPLRNHQHAFDAAVASECAAEQGRFSQYYSLLFTDQGSLGERSWHSYAESAGVKDLGAFERCMRDETPSGRIEAHRAYGQRIGLRGTPTVLINGHRLPRPPQSAQELRTAIRDALNGASNHE